MPIATHIIKIEGTFSKDWTEDKLKEFVARKIQTEIDVAWHPDLELFGIKQPNIIKIWVYVQEAAIGLANEDIVSRWLKDHIKEEGLEVTNIEVEKVPYEEGFVIQLNDASLRSLKERK